jgi:hypothetical protein
MTKPKPKNDRDRWYNLPITICLISTIGVFLITSFYQWNQDRIKERRVAENKVRELALEVSMRAAVLVSELVRIEDKFKQDSEELDATIAEILRSVVQNPASTNIESLKTCFIRQEYKNSSIYSILCELQEYDDSQELRTILSILGSYFYVSQSLSVGDASKPGLEYLRQLKRILEFQIPVEYSYRLMAPYKHKNVQGR